MGKGEMIKDSISQPQAEKKNLQGNSKSEMSEMFFKNLKHWVLHMQGECLSHVWS